MSLVHEMERIGRITAADQGLEVRVRGVKAYAVPGIVTIPNISTFEWLGKNAYRMLHGLLDHECGHAADSDFEATKQFRLTRPPKALDILLNVIEDGYVERLRGIRYKGCGDNIRLMNEWFYQHKGPDGKNPIERIVDGSNKWASFLSALGMVLTPYGFRDIEFFKPLNPDVYQMLVACKADIEELQNITESQATAKNIEIAKRIYDRFNQNSEQNQESESDDSDEEESEDKEEGEGGAGSESGDEDDEGEEAGEEETEEDEGEAGEEGGDEENDGGEENGEEDKGKAGEEGDEDDEGEEAGEEETEEDEGETGEEGDEDDEGEEVGEEDEGADGSDIEVEVFSEDDDGDDSDSTGSDTDEGEGEQDADGTEPPEAGTYIMDLDRWSDVSNAPLNASDQINVILGEIFEHTGVTQPYTIFSHEFDAYRDFASEDQTEVSEKYEQEIKEVYNVADSLIQCFEAALRATQMARPVGGNDEGDIDSDVLGEYAVGSLPADQLYIQYAETDSDNVAVSILCDCSGSMHGLKAMLCRRTAMAISHALQQVHIPHEVGGFCTLESHEVNSNPWTRDRSYEYADGFIRMRRALMEAQDRGTDVTKFAREVKHRYGSRLDGRTILQVPIHVTFKSFESDDARSLARIDSISENLDGEAVYWIAKRLAQRPERRKVLFVLSDGLPAGSRDNLQGARYLKETIDRVINAGIEIYGIGIKSEHVKTYYPEWWLCDKIEDLISIAMEGLTEVLTRNRQERTRIDL